MKKIYILGVVMIMTAIIVFVCMAPHVIRKTISSENKVSYEQPIPYVAHGCVLSQQFVPQYERMKSIEVYINALSCSREQGFLHIKIVDDREVMIYENKIALSMLPAYGMTSIVEDVTLVTGDVYTLSIEAVDTLDDGPAISFFPNMIAANEEERGGKLTYAGQLLDNSVLRASFRYSVPLSLINYPAYCLFIAFVICFSLECFLCKPKK